MRNTHRIRALTNKIENLQDSIRYEWINPIIIEKEILNIAEEVKETILNLIENVNLDNIQFKKEFENK